MSDCKLSDQLKSDHACIETSVHIPHQWRPRHLHKELPSGIELYRALLTLIQKDVAEALTAEQETWPSKLSENIKRTFEVVVNVCNRRIPSRERIVIRKIETLMHGLRR
jgi:hypothetical protein